MNEYRERQKKTTRRKSGNRTLALLVLLIAVIIISSNLRDGNIVPIADIKASYELVDSIEVRYEDASRGPKMLEGVYLAQVKQAFSPLKNEMTPSKSMKLDEMTKLATLSYKIGGEELFSAPVYVDSEGNMYQIYAKSQYVKTKSLSFLK